MNLLILLCSFVFANAAVLPPFILPCRSSVNLNECILNNIEAAKPFVIDGLPELSLPSFRLIRIPYSFVNYSAFEFGVWNYNVTGLDNFEVLQVNADVSNNVFQLKAIFPYGEGRGPYGLKGKLFNLDFDSTGQIVANGTNLILDYTLRTKIVQRNGKFYFARVSQEAHIAIPDGTFQVNLDNLYLGNTEITAIMKRILNENSQYLFRALVPILENTLLELFGKAIDVFFETYTYNELLL